MDTRWNYKKTYQTEGHTLLRRVSELIDPVSGEWDSHLIKDVFWEKDVKRILGIPIKNGMEDLLAWHYDNKGLCWAMTVYSCV